MMRRLATTMLPVMLALALGACEQEGPAERAGEEIDRAAEDVEESMEEMGDEK